MDTDDLQPAVMYESTYRRTCRRAEALGVTGDMLAELARREADAAALAAEKALRAARKARKAQRSERRCIECGIAFVSHGPHNRLCRPSCGTAPRRPARRRDDRVPVVEDVGADSRLLDAVSEYVA